LGRSKSLPDAGFRLHNGLPSRRSALHDVGGCQPCAWFWKPGGCKNDQECSRCHACPEGELKVRKRVKKTMQRLGYVTPVTPETLVSNFFPEPLKATPVMTEGESTSCSGSELESLAAGSYVEADAEGSCAPLTPQRVPEWSGGAPLGFYGLAATPVFESGTLSTGADADHEEDEEELFACSSLQTSSLHAPPGLELPNAGDTNNGALLHEMGACQPCAWFWKPSGCQNGKDCMRCHLCPEGELRARKKVKRTMMRLGLVTPKAKGEYPMAASAAFELPIA